MPDTVNGPIETPYVGPRTFKEEEAHLFFGRKREAGDLLSLVMSERLVLFYAQSGAGKSSLINTQLRPGLRDEGFGVLPTGRVSGSLPTGIAKVDNIYTFNLILRLDEERHQASDFIHLPLSHYLAQHRDKNGNNKSNGNQAQVLIIDQFEEILTTNVKYWEQREIFFKQLRQAMQEDPLLWVVLALREDYVASLDPYAHLLPGKLDTRFYMRRLNRKAALEAIVNPADKAERPFQPNAAQILVDNLRQIRLQDQSDEAHLGEFVEPVQLQAVCFQMWEKLKERPGREITEQMCESWPMLTGL